MNFVQPLDQKIKMNNFLTQEERCISSFLKIPTSRTEVLLNGGIYDIFLRNQVLSCRLLWVGLLHQIFKAVLWTKNIISKIGSVFSLFRQSMNI